MAPCPSTAPGPRREAPHTPVGTARSRPENPALQTVSTRPGSTGSARCSPPG
ncbi:hypothetical protein MC885_015163 [Smutsia gigantea]|nr:hypothetical protein MC885_015163 [Smutsia gigantea]